MDPYTSRCTQKYPNASNYISKSRWIPIQITIRGRQHEYPEEDPDVQQPQIELSILNQMYLTRSIQVHIAQSHFTTNEAEHFTPSTENLKESSIITPYKLYMTITYSTRILKEQVAYAPNNMNVTEPIPNASFQLKCFDGLLFKKL